MKRFVKSQKGITLIALVITIVVLLILAGVSLNAIIGNNGIVSRAGEASFKSKMAQFIDDTQTYIVGRQSDGIAGMAENEYYANPDYIYCGDINLNPTYKERLEQIRNVILSATHFDISGLTWDEITEMDDQLFLERLALEAGELIWFASSEKDEEVQWCLDLGVHVFVIGRGYLDESGEYVVGSTGDYGNTVGAGTTQVTSGVFCCAPDLKGFNTGSTYYVTYSGEQPIIGDQIYKDAPTDWYDYGTKKWANIVTSSNGHLAYFTWVPRYMYKVSSENGEVVKTGDGKVDIKFVDLDNRYVGGAETLTEEQLKSQGYVLPDGFKFDGKDLAGIWVGKYEISDPEEPIGFYTTSTDSSISVNKFTVSGASKAEVDEEDMTKKEITVSIEGFSEKKGKLSDGPVTIEGLSPDRVYTVTVTIPTIGLDPLVLTKEVRTAKGTVNDIAAPDLTGFNPTTTFYVTYTDKNNENTLTKGDAIATKDDPLEQGRKVASNAPADWYDYTKNYYANIKTESNGLESYWTWIPRYEYKIDNTLQTVDIIFITADQTKADEGYLIPDGFKFDGKELSGIWVAKAEISDTDVPSAFTAGSVTGGFKINSLTYCTGPAKTSGATTKAGTMYLTDSKGARVSNANILVNGAAATKGSNNTFTVDLGQTVTGLEPGTYTAYWTIYFRRTDGSEGSETLQLSVTAK